MPRSHPTSMYLVFPMCIAKASSTDLIYIGQSLLQIETLNVLFEVKTSLGALSKNFVDTELDSRVTLGSVTLVRVKSARDTAI